MQHRKIHKRQVIVTDPNTGKKVNVMPVFDLLKMLDPAQTNLDGFQLISSMVDKEVIRIINERWLATASHCEHSQYMFFLLYRIKDMFLEMNVD